MKVRTVTQRMVPRLLEGRTITDATIEFTDERYYPSCHAALSISLDNGAKIKFLVQEGDADSSVSLLWIPPEERERNDPQLSSREPGPT